MPHLEGNVVRSRGGRALAIFWETANQLFLAEDSYLGRFFAKCTKSNIPGKNQISCLTRNRLLQKLLPKPLY